MNINKKYSITITFKDNGWEVGFSETNPDYRPIRLTPEGDYDELYNEAIHAQQHLRRYVFDNYDKMLELVAKISK